MRAIACFVALLGACALVRGNADAQLGREVQDNPFDYPEMIVRAQGGSYLRLVRTSNPGGCSSERARGPVLLQTGGLQDCLCLRHEVQTR